MSKKTVLHVLLLLLAWGLYSQTPPAQPLPNGFREIELGMSLDEVKEKLKGDSYFDYRGDPDVNLLTTPNKSVIECAGSFFIRRAFFQFHKEELYIIILLLDPTKIDYFTMYTTFVNKYGEPDSLNPEEALWDDGEIRLSLERPLSVKYIAMDVFNMLKKENDREESVETFLKERFLNEF